MRVSRLFARTLREDPSEADVPSHRLLLRAAFIRKVAAGIYTTMPLGLRTMAKIERIVRDEMDAAGSQELRMPIVLPAEPWKETRLNAGDRLSLGAMESIPEVQNNV